MKRFTAILCLMSLILSLAISCGKNVPAEADEATTEAPAETHALTGFELEVKDWGGRTFTVLTSKPENPSFQNFEVYVEAENGEILNDAIYNRNRTLEELLDVKIAERVCPTEKPPRISVRLF